jgi:RNA polymerase sigma-B factor
MYPFACRLIRKGEKNPLVIQDEKRKIDPMSCGGHGTDVERGRLIESYLPLAGQVARRFARFSERQDDLEQVAALALVQAIDRRDPRRPGALPAYVLRCVEGEVRRHLRDRASTVRLPRSVQGADARARMSTAAQAVADSARAPLTLHEDDAHADSAPLDELGLNRALVARAMRALDFRERQIVVLRFFLDRTQAEIAESLELSQAHVSRLLDEALAKMRRRLAREEALYRGKRSANLDGYEAQRRAAG